MKKYILFLLIIISVSVPVYAAEDEFPSGMSEGEKRQMLDEMYDDIEKDEDFVPSDSDISIPDIEKEDGQPEKKSSTMTDEELREKLIEMMPDEDDIESFSGAASERVMDLAGFTLSYDRAKNLYRYLFPDGRGFSMSVPLGGWSDRSVAIIPDEDVHVSSVEKDGEVLTGMVNSDGSYLFREAGRYTFQISDAASDDSGVIPGSFRIFDPALPITDSFIWYPEGYTAKEIYLDKMPQKQDTPSYFRMKEDGIYEFLLSPKRPGDPFPEIRLMFKRDTCPPVILWDGEVEEGRFTGDVSYSLPEEDTVVTIWFNGQRAFSQTGVLAAAGNYYITAEDPAGNERSYSFVIRRRGKIPWAGVAAAAGILIIIAVLTVISGARRLKVK